MALLKEPETRRTARVAKRGLARAVAIIAIAAALQPVGIVQAGAVEPGPDSLMWPSYRTSGRGEVTTRGHIDPTSNALVVDSLDTWEPGMGIRVARAGPPLRIDSADAGWVGGAGEAHSDDRKEGSASARCAAPATVVRTEAVELCSVTFPSPRSFRYDELRLWVSTSVTTAPNQIELVAFRSPTPENRTGEVEHGQMELPEVPSGSAGTWLEMFVPIEGEAQEVVTRLVVRCRFDCAAVVVQIDDIWAYRDLFAVVGGTDTATRTLLLVDQAGEPVRPGRRIDAGDKTVVFHDDTRAIRRWLASRPTGATNHLAVPKGVYYVNRPQSFDFGTLEKRPSRSNARSLPVPSDTTIRCESGAVFRNTGGSETGASPMFKAVSTHPHRISVSGCGFDLNGYRREFATILDLGTDQPAPARAARINVLNNSFEDSRWPGMAGCDVEQDVCATRQRQYIVVQGAAPIDSRMPPDHDYGARIEANVLKHGGRIKAGGRSRAERIYIRRNTIDFVNDNAITVAQTASGVTRDVEITGNFIRNPLSVGIFFGGDGESNAAVADMTTMNVRIERNHIVGFFRSGIRGFLPQHASNIKIASNIIESHRERATTANVTGIQVKRGVPQCADGIDNDQDGAVDFGADPDCTHRFENLEGPGTGRVFTDLPTAGVDITTNRVLGWGPYGQLDQAIAVEGPITDVSVAGNQLGCGEQLVQQLSARPPPDSGRAFYFRFNPDIECPHRPFENGIRFRAGPFEATEVRDNEVSEGATNLWIGALSGERANFTIDGNEFVGARDPGSGQIHLASTTAPLAATITSNRFANGAGFAIFCAGGGHYDLRIIANTVEGPSEGPTSSECART